MSTTIKTFVRISDITAADVAALATRAKAGRRDMMFWRSADLVPDVAKSAVGWARRFPDKADALDRANMALSELPADSCERRDIGDFLFWSIVKVALTA